MPFRFTFPFAKAVLMACAVFLVVFSAASAHADATETDAVRNRMDEATVIHSHNGNCVRTKWNNDGDPCAPPKPPQPPVAYVPPPAPAPVHLPPPVMVRRPIIQTLVEEEKRTVYFAFDKADLSSEARAKLDALAVVLKQAKDIQQVDIVGYADKMGRAKHNIPLSERRAKAVEDYLHQQNYYKTSIAKVRGVGSSEAMAQCKSKKRVNKIACDSPDRKVTVEIVYSKDVMVKP